MPWKLSSFLALVFFSGIHAESYLALHRRLALEMKQPMEQISAFEIWIREQRASCSHQYQLSEKQNCLVKVVYQETGVIFDTTLAIRPEDLLPMNLVKGKYGSCVSISFLVMLLGEATEMRSEAVSLPGHVYVKLMGGRNWEPNRSGFAYTDAEYREKYKIDESIGRGVRTLNNKEFEGMVRYEWANRLVLQKNYSAALQQFQRAEMLWRDARVAGNRALLLEEMGERHKARRILDSLWNGGARSEELVWNRSLVMLRGSEALEIVDLFLEEADGRRVSSPRLVNLRKRLQQEMSK